MGQQASPLVVGRYAIFRKIASGGMASVHLGRLLGAEGFARTVAVKRLHAHLAEDPEFRIALIDEARLASRIHHPNVVATLDVVTTGGELLIVLEYVRGESLSRLLRAGVERGSRVPLPVLSAIVVGALHGLQAAHEATNGHGVPLDLVHRDVSPQNILVGTDGVARIIDFGVAKAVGRVQTTREGVLKGKMAYMAPELLTGAKVTRQVDLYAMAVVLWEGLTGKRLFRGENDGAVFGQVVAGANEPPSAHVPDLPAGLDALVMTGLSPDPAERFPSARSMADKLKSIVPPAFPTDVGDWVEDVARESLAERGALLAEIESSGIAIVSQSARPTRPEIAAEASDSAVRRTSPERQTGAEVVSGTSRPSTPSVETPRPAAPTSRAARYARLVGALGAAALLAAGAAFIGTQHGGKPAPGERAASTVGSPMASSLGVAVTAASSVADTPSTSALAEASATASATTAPSASAPPSSTRSAATSPRTHHMASSSAKPRPTASAPAILFTQPD